jgi:hypothetical protein
VTPPNLAHLPATRPPAGAARRDRRTSIPGPEKESEQAAEAGVLLHLAAPSRTFASVFKGLRHVTHVTGGVARNPLKGNAFLACHAVTGGGYTRGRGHAHELAVTL